MSQIWDNEKRLKEIQTRKVGWSGGRERHALEAFRAVDDLLDEVRRLQAQVKGLEHNLSFERASIREKFDQIEDLKAERDRERQRAQRLWDLVRYTRHKLFEENLISKEEFAELVQDHSAVARLESYDEVRQQAEKAEAVMKQARISLAEHRCGTGSCHCCRSIQAIDAAMKEAPYT